MQKLTVTITRYSRTCLQMTMGSRTHSWHLPVGPCGVQNNGRRIAKYVLTGKSSYFLYKCGCLSPDSLDPTQESGHETNQLMVWNAYSTHARGGGAASTVYVEFSETRVLVDERRYHFPFFSVFGTVLKTNFILKYTPALMAVLKREPDELSCMPVPPRISEYEPTTAKSALLH